jgi:hypothetical protein
LAADLEETFGQQVVVRFVDADKTGLNDYPLVNRVLQMGYPFPITVINGEPKFAGGIMAPELKKSIEEILNS